MRKYRLARPPRSGVGLPTSDATRPFSSRRSRAAYTLPISTSRLVLSSMALEIGTPYAPLPKRITASITISSKFPGTSRDILVNHKEEINGSQPLRKKISRIQIIKTAGLSLVETGKVARRATLPEVNDETSP